MVMSNGSQLPDISLSELKTYHVGALESGAHRALRQYKDDLLNRYDISGMEWYVIGAVADAGHKGTRITDLANRMGTTLGFMTKTVNMLAAKGFLVREANPKDARTNTVRLADGKQQTVNKIENELRQRLRKSIYSLITREELATYVKVIKLFSEIQ